MTVVELKKIGFYTKGKNGFIGYFTTKTGLPFTVEGYLHLLKKKAFNVTGQKIVLPYSKNGILSCYNITDIYFT